MIDKDLTVRKSLEGLATNYKNAKTDKERSLDDQAAKNLLDFFIGDKELYQKYMDFYNKEKEDKNLKLDLGYPPLDTERSSR
jgi:hypothetical protein